MGMSLSKLGEMVRDREACSAAVRGAAKESDTTGQLNNNNNLHMNNSREDERAVTGDKD